MFYGKKSFAAVLLALPCALGATACGPGSEPVCGGFSPVPPTAEEVPDGRLVAKLDGAAFDQAGSWGPGPNGSIDAGLLTLVIPKDEKGSDVAELLGRGLPYVCIPLGERSETSGNATYDSTFVTDADHTGMVAILGEDGDFVTGRFEVTLKNASGATATFTDGAFRIPRR